MKTFLSVTCMLAKISFECLPLIFLKKMVFGRVYMRLHF